MLQIQIDEDMPHRLFFTDTQDFRTKGGKALDEKETKMVKEWFDLFKRLAND